METSFSWRSWLSEYLNLRSKTVDQLANRFARVHLVADSETLEHTLRATKLACELAEKIRLPEKQRISFRQGAMLHDLGKLLIPREILAKSSPLTTEDWAVLKRHTYFTYLLLCDIPELEPALDIPLAHHECWNGSGYPHGLKGEAIPIAARIYSIADVWDALNSPRPYRPAFSFAEARRMIAEFSGKYFDPIILSEFLKMLPEG